MHNKLMKIVSNAFARTCGIGSCAANIETSDSGCLGCFVDDLLTNGVIVPPCKVGDTVYFIQSKRIFEGRVILIRPFIYKDHTNFHGNVLYKCIDPFYSDGRITEHQIWVVFEEYGENTIAYLTREEAEQALRKEDEGK